MLTVGRVNLEIKIIALCVDCWEKDGKETRIVRHASGLVDFNVEAFKEEFYASLIAAGWHLWRYQWVCASHYLMARRAEAEEKQVAED